jgi:hypothetical protein
LPPVPLRRQILMALSWPPVVTAAEPSHRGAETLEVTGTLRPMFTIVIGTDDFGADALLLRDEDALPGGETRWRFVAQTDDEVIAAGVLELMVRRCYSDTPSAA